MIEKNIEKANNMELIQYLEKNKLINNTGAF